MRNLVNGKDVLKQFLVNFGEKGKHIPKDVDTSDPLDAQLAHETSSALTL